MEAIFQWIYIALKIAVVAAIYSFTLIMIVLAIGEIKPYKFILKIEKEKMNYWFALGRIISILLITYTLIKGVLLHPL